MRNGTWTLFAAALAALGHASGAAAADYPAKPIQLVVPYSAGGSTDLLARAVAQVAPRYLPQPLVVVNKAGGGAIPGRLDVVRSAPDGYTLLFGYIATHGINPALSKVPYDPVRDFAPITLAASSIRAASWSRILSSAATLAGTLTPAAITATKVIAMTTLQKALVTGTVEDVTRGWSLALTCVAPCWYGPSCVTRWTGGIPRPSCW